MDESPEERQKQEITVLQSIYDKDFLEALPPQVWKVRAVRVFWHRYKLLKTSA